MTRRGSGWAIGWSMFAATLMLLMGAQWITSGLVALVSDDFFVATPDYVFRFDVTTWGWIHLVVGVVILMAGIGIFGGWAWARVVGVILAAVAGLVAFVWLPWYPIWAILFIALSVAVIWSLTAHGHDLSDAV